ncbi:MAG: DNA-3-methyladenine glycosylase 2 family protein [Oscillospiraceae bacterium]|nr:DNA-3-methyladenine glycosylase 2 family protein [Oscillospiraceae bacterium]
MDYSVKAGDIILSEEHFSLDETLDCGQAFRWESVPSDFFRTYKGYYKNYPLTISETQKGKFILHNTTEADFLNIWKDYFDLDTDYGELKRRFSEDETLAAACAYAGGIHLLRQDAEECLISFIISQNNNIPRIKGIIGRLCEMYGGFPDFKRLEGVTAEELAPLRAGFRAGYLEDCAKKVNSGEINLEKIREMPAEAGAKELMKIKGVGPKVAMCALLFGMYKTAAYPVDVWIKRVNERYYPNGLPDCVKGVQGIAQQYLFHYIRTGAPKESKV